MSMSPQLAVAAMAITVLLPSEGRQGGSFHSLTSVGRSRRRWNQLTLLLLLGHDAVDFVRFRNVELGALGHLLEVRAFIESTAKSRLPGGRFSLVPLLVLAFKNSPGL